MTIEEQIAELNEEVKCHIAPSPIHGIGVFTLCDVTRGEKLYCFPNALAAAMFISPIGPQPETRTFNPETPEPSRLACTASPKGSIIAACSGETSRGTGQHTLCGTTTNGAKPPSKSTPG